MEAASSRFYDKGLNMDFKDNPDKIAAKMTAERLKREYERTNNLLLKKIKSDKIWANWETDYGSFFESIIKSNRYKTCIEIGVAHGQTTGHMCRAAQNIGGHVYGFDIWDSHGSAKNNFEQKSSMELVDRQLKPRWPGIFTLNKIDSLNPEFPTFLKETLQNKPIDFAFIDGDHSYAGIKNDFKAVYPLLSPSGVIAFHDTAWIDGCREFVLDLRAKFHDGTFDIVDFHFGGDPEQWPGGRSGCGISLLVKRSFALKKVPIQNVCGSLSTEQEIETREQEWLLKQIETKNKTFDLDEYNKKRSNEEMCTKRFGVHRERKWGCKKWK